ncbi:1-deoxy-D-xylulose-5-phosphate reductoisomerase [Acetomicrobium hydrogeniformans]|uniref:1-deoxy-D-xylulose 5-phosphate reductoisomerase n=1 Tax=Acetomicrobium hydrogeniformans TaxID=649746 RepID=A0A7V7BYH3_9BACT|nr:1-deoxy-D-xylulose-5-phosphate reductoisomerase [Acetomicrobium hydrogeniformans]HHZ04363.1 1-deoxy-D-xylulose-5-phosphate reductoisomerase [Acetomicrobium hydrogeniformans]
MSQKRLAVIGATGSIGRAALDVCRRFPEEFDVRALAVRSNIEELKKLVDEFKPKYVVIYDDVAASKFALHDESVKVLVGHEGLMQLIDEGMDHIVFASSGTEAIAALSTSLDRKIEVSLANKESLIVGGPWIMEKASLADPLRPIDSEHNAVWQCLLGEDLNEIEEIILTASGGPFLHSSYEEMKLATPSSALKHPTWSMGSKITVDSATLLNKGFEVIEASYLFALPIEKINAVVQPDSLAHGCVRFSDGSVKMFLSEPDMRIPISFALSYPKRLKIGHLFHRLAITEKWTLDFLRLDENKFPCYSLARRALQMGNAYPPIIVGADEVAVEAFVKGKISIVDIFPLLEKVLLSYNGPSNLNGLEEAISLVEFGRRIARELCRLFSERR